MRIISEKRTTCYNIFLTLVDVPRVSRIRCRELPVDYGNSNKTGVSTWNGPTYNFGV
jgi:hypothetical protein